MSTYLDKVLSRNTYTYLFLLFVSLAVYVGVIKGPFFFDDNIFIENNAYVQTFDVVKIYTSSTTEGSGLTGDNFYRPNGQLIYSLILLIFGAVPAVFHFISILLHSGVGFLVFLLFCLLGLDRRYSLLASVIFIVHPIQTQAVSYISGLSEPLVAITTLGILVVFTRGLLSDHKFSIRRTLLIVLLSVIGFFSKENAVTVSPLMLLVVVFLYKQGKISSLLKGLWVWVFVASLSALYLFFRFTTLNFTHDLTGGFGISTQSNIYTESLYVRLVTFISSVYNYPFLSLLPINLHYERPYFAYDSLLSFWGFVGLIIIIFSIYIAYVSLRSKKGTFFFAVSWFAISILPVSGIIPTNAIYLDHWLYVPIIGFLFLLAVFLENNRDKNLFLYVTIIVIFILAGLTIDRNKDWADPIRFYKNELQYTQSATRIYNNLAMEMANRGNCLEAIPYYRRAIIMDDSYPQTHHNLARCLEDMGETEGAISEYKKALAIDPKFIYSINRLQVLLGEK